MKKVVLLLVTVSVLAGIAWAVWGRSGESSAAAAGTALARPALTVELGIGLARRDGRSRDGRRQPRG